jgi:hypothetical protein
MNEWMKESKGWLKSTVTKGGLKSPVFDKGKKLVTVHGINKGSVKKTMHMNHTSCYSIVYC